MEKNFFGSAPAERSLSLLYLQSSRVKLRKELLPPLFIATDGRAVTQRGVDTNCDTVVTSCVYLGASDMPSSGTNHPVTQSRKRVLLVIASQTQPATFNCNTLRGSHVCKWCVCTV